MRPLITNGGVLTELVTTSRLDDSVHGSSDTDGILALVEAARNGDREACGRLVTMNQRVVYRPHALDAGQIRGEPVWPRHRAMESGSDARYTQRSRHWTVRDRQAEARPATTDRGSENR